jgi:hypothetical protein
LADLNHLAKLFRAVAARDWNSAVAVAREVASAEERIGHHVAAQRLRGALTSNGHGLRADSVGEGPELSQSGSSTYLLSNALTPIEPGRDFSALRLRRSMRTELVEVISEWRQREKLAARRIKRRTKLLFHGPPGCGKSATAAALGRELGLSVYVVRFDAIVGAYLGQTALHLRQLFRFAEMTPCVILVDEIDALGKRRGNPLDVGELDRVVISLLQELEHSQPAGLLIATSNLAGQLDDALWRRFDLVVEFPRPSAVELRLFSAQQAKARRVALTPRLRKALGHVKSFADAEGLINAEERRQVLKGE